MKWIGENIPRSNFAQDLLFSFGSALTICRISRNNAEERLRNMEKNRWAAGSDGYVTVDLPSDETEETFQDVEELARDQIIRLIGSRFKGHELARLVNGILAAQGYHTFMSPPGPDGGVDILAGTVSAKITGRPGSIRGSIGDGSFGGLADAVGDSAGALSSAWDGDFQKALYKAARATGAIFRLPAVQIYDRARKITNGWGVDKLPDLSGNDDNNRKRR